jgi:hypothetical protein
MHGVLRCVSVTNVNTGSEFTMTSRVLNLTGSATLGTLGTQSWPVQAFWLLPGDPSPTAAVLAQATGTLGGSTLRAPSSALVFNATLTSSFISVAGAQLF